MKHYVAMDIWKSFCFFIRLTFRCVLRRWHKKGQSSLNFAIDFFWTSATRREGKRGRERCYLWEVYAKLHVSLDTRECRREFSKSKTVGKFTVRICTCLDYAVHLHKQHKPGFINHRAPGNTCLINRLIFNEAWFLDIG